MIEVQQLGPGFAAEVRGVGLADVAADDAAYAAAAEEAGIVVRPFAGDGARVSIGEPEANDRIIQVAAAFADPRDGG